MGPSSAAAATSAMTSASENARCSTVCTINTPFRRPRSTTGTPRNAWYGSSPASAKYLKRGCFWTSVHDGLHLLGHHPRQSLTQVHADLPDTVLTQPHRRGQDQMGAVGLEQIDRTDVDRQPRLYRTDTLGQHAGRLVVASGLGQTLTGI